MSTRRWGENKTTRRDSRSVRAEVLDALKATAGVDESEIQIAVDGWGVVRMTGHAPSWAHWRAAERAIQIVRGVQAVANDLQVRPSNPSVRHDTDIAEAALRARIRGCSVPEDQIIVTLRDGGVSRVGRWMGSVNATLPDTGLKTSTKSPSFRK
jgi:hypothetical protein